MIYIYIDHKTGFQSQFNMQPVITTDMMHSPFLQMSWLLEK